MGSSSMKVRSDLRDECDVGGVGLEALLAAAQNAGVAAFQADHGAVDGDVGAGLVDDADDADRDPELAEVQAVGPGEILEDVTDGIGQGGDRADGLGEVLQAGGREGETVAGGGGEGGGLGGGEILGVGGEERGMGGVDQAGEFEERGVFRGRRGRRQPERRGAGARREGGDELDEIGGHGNPRGK